MAYSQEIRDRARAHYIYDRLGCEAIADKLAIPEKTIRRWKACAEYGGDHWERARSAARVASGGLGDLTARVIEEFALLFEATIAELKARVGDKERPIDPIAAAEALARLSDAYAKTMKAAGAADPKMSQLGTALKTLEEFANYLRERAPELLPAFAAHIDGFGTRLSEVFG